MLFPKKINRSQAETFFKNTKLYEILNKRYISSFNYKPNYLDLYSIYQTIYLNKRTTVLEFGSGTSTLVIAKCLSILKKKFSNDIKKIIRANPFELFFIENEKKYLNYTKKSLNLLKPNIKFNSYFSDVIMTTYKDLYCTKYKKLPRCNPDFIYLDGPGQDMVKKNVDNFTISKNIDMCPMACDILKFEFFLLPGTIIMVDGRGQNTLFLRKNLKRNWKYKYIEHYDQHFLFLDEKYLGPINKRQLKFYKF